VVDDFTAVCTSSGETIAKTADGAPDRTLNHTVSGRYGYRVVQLDVFHKGTICATGLLRSGDAVIAC
jgi:hypothetical protein